MNALITRRGLRGLNWLIAIMALYFAVSGLLAPDSESALWAGPAVTSILCAALLWFVRHPGEWTNLVDNFANMFPPEEQEHRGEDTHTEAPAPRRRSA